MEIKKVIEKLEKDDIYKPNKLLMQKYLMRLVAGTGTKMRSDKSKRNAINVLKIVAKWLGKRKFSVFRSEDTFNSFVVDSKTRGIQDSTLNWYKLMLKQFLLWHFKKNPPEITMHIPLLAKEKGVPFAEVPSREESAAGKEQAAEGRRADCHDQEREEIDHAGFIESC